MAKYREETEPGEHSSVWVLAEAVCSGLHKQLSLTDGKEKGQNVFILGQKLAAQSSKNEGKDSLGSCCLKSNEKSEE